MSRLCRPSILLIVSAAFAIAAAILFVRKAPSEARAEPRPVQSGDQEIVFLYQANSGATWERLVAAAIHLQKQRGFKLDIARAYPEQTTEVPEVIVQTEPGKRRLVFRWYKVTSTQTAGDWIEALLKRPTRPLAIIGGNTSDMAWQLARELKRLTQSIPERQRPLLLLTAATAERVEPHVDAGAAPIGPEDWGILLTDIYAGRTFRFCFTNRQMAADVVDFLWSQPELRPDPNPVYSAYWEDDSYSKDLSAQFEYALNRFNARAVAREWAWALGATTTGAYPWHLAFPRVEPVRSEVLVPPQYIPSSVGTFDRPNRWEWDAARWLIDEFRKQTTRRRPLLVLTGQSKPSRRFLRSLEQYDRAAARKFIVASGDSLAFNTIFRDRDVNWPIQDLPFDLVFFCHRNPVDNEAGFRPDSPPSSAEDSSGASSTDDKLLFEDILLALMDTAAGAYDAVTPSEVADRLRSVRVRERSLFRPDGNRRSGTGEHVVWLHPTVKDGRELPEATLTVWAVRPEGGASGRWQLAAPARVINYEESSRGGGSGHVGN